MKIYTFLKQKGSASVSELVSVVKLTQPTVSYHLKEMKDSGLLVSEKKGKEVFYAISGTCPIYEDSCVLNEVEFAGGSQ
jgi:DNA-binding transcriptional ArsR family regulator